eukprot:TRINITY_DN9666_c0_g1_i2.p1 TRINITY_DN9666_c0_g1~~TRINITY_DN9666_c0_g1_i2.p1  ORF type:complete len:334 (-),score=50.25 TRINITY_DN9666_c0_g1_i2:22-1023(-)
MRDNHWDVTFVSSAREGPGTELLRSIGINTMRCQINHENEFDVILDKVNPNLVLFDRFITEEQFGWRVYKYRKYTPIVIDTQDLHFLRLSRQQAVQSLGFKESVWSIKDTKIDNNSEYFLREMSSILRSNLSLVVSSFERQFLIEEYKISPSMTKLSTLYYKPIEEYVPYRRGEITTSYEKKNNFVMIGNFRHPPNYDGVLWMHNTIWPEIRKRIPTAQLHIYGVNPDSKMMSLTDSDSGFIIKGPIKHEQLYEKLSQYRVHLAPLRFGAGIKGKIADNWWVGNPSVSTFVGAEGMTLDNNGEDYALEWGGFIENEPLNFSDKAVLLLSLIHI